jgi:sugar lactone lactonase YvrE
MAEIHDFQGTVFCDTKLELGEGPSYDPSTDTVYWFNILGRQLHEKHLPTGRKNVHALPLMASVIVRIDDGRQLLATEDGLFIRNRASGALTPHAALEPDKPGNRSNDGRMHPSGALWIGTMGKTGADGVGSIYHVAAGTVTKLFDNHSIPNSICFAPDGSVGYFTDTRQNRIMRVDLDAATGLPTAKPSVLVDAHGQDGGCDGSVCDAEGMIWNARWGLGAVDRYDASGRHLDRYLLPAKQTSCPAFIGPAASRMIVTSAMEGMSEAKRAADPQAGQTFDLGIDVKGVFDAAYRL